MYLSLADLKLRLGITDNTRDAELNLLLDQSRSTIVWLGYDFTEKSYKKITRCRNWFEWMQLDAPNIKSIDKVSWVEVIRQNKKEYIVKWQYDHIVVFGEINQFTWDYGSEIEVEYTAWYASWQIPATLAEAQYLMICAIKFDQIQSANLFAGKKDVKQHSAWPRSVTYTDQNSSSELKNKAYNIFKSIFNPIPLP